MIIHPYTHKLKHLSCRTGKIVYKHIDIYTKMTEKFACECGSMFTKERYRTSHTHLSSDKHQNWAEKLKPLSDSELAEEEPAKPETYLFFDAETTGLAKNFKAPVDDVENWPNVVQLSWILCNPDGSELEKNDLIVKPCDFKIPKAASDIHGITTDRALTEGVDLKVVLELFSTVLKKADYIVAHNTEFDSKVIGCEYFRASIYNPLPHKQSICTMNNQKITNYCKLSPFGYGPYKWPKLVELHEKLFGCGFDNMHNAKFDVEALVKCFWELKRLTIL
jgi:DNA polymerase-3 subunit epsilon